MFTMHLDWEEYAVLMQALWYSLYYGPASARKKLESIRDKAEAAKLQAEGSMVDEAA